MSEVIDSDFLNWWLLSKYKFWLGFKEIWRRIWARRYTAIRGVINWARRGYLLDIIVIRICGRLLDCLYSDDVSYGFIGNFMIIVIFFLYTIPRMLLIRLCRLYISFKLFFRSMTIDRISFKIFWYLIRYIFRWILYMNFTLIFICIAIGRWFYKLRTLPFIFRHYYILCTHTSKIIYIKLFFGIISNHGLKISMLCFGFLLFIIHKTIWVLLTFKLGFVECY